MFNIRILLTTAVAGLIVALLITSCNPKKEGPVLFEALRSEKTGINFVNKLEAKQNFFLLKYMYFYNGAGIGAGDFNQDGLTDLFFASNQGQCKLFLNQGGLTFKDVSKEAGIPNDGGWSTGVSIADINQDGLLDIYVCRVGNFETLRSRNILLICKSVAKNGVPVFEEEAEKYGVSFSGFSTQSAFFDYDLDGDLDMFLLNHSLRYNTTFEQRETYRGTIDSLAGDRFFRNDNGMFKDISAETGINRSVIGYGLGIAVSDINLDGYPDIYIGNDFHENDYLYLNNRKGGFTEELTTRTTHTSQFSMGVDVADVTNDAYPEIISLDMLPSDPYILKRSLGEDDYNLANIKLKYGYCHQYARNALQLNRRNGLFSEVGLAANVYATDWSWAALWMDFDNDGWKDLFVSNGIPKRLNDIDYVNYVSNDEIQAKIKTDKITDKDIAALENFPQIKLPNRFFINDGKGDAIFNDIGERVKNNDNTFSNGAVYADLDNDGDLDIVVNNIDDPVLIYQNRSNDKKDKKNCTVRLNGPEKNKQAIGAKIIICSGKETRTYENFPVHGFLSSMQIPIHIGLTNTVVDSAWLVWPDNTFEAIQLQANSTGTEVSYKPGLPPFSYEKITNRYKNSVIPITNIASHAGLNFKHKENDFVEFDREQLIPFMTSRDGPALATGDINADGLEDFFIGSAKGEKSKIFIQQSNGKFSLSIQPGIDTDSTYEDVDACWTDVNKDGYKDLVVASGGNEYFGVSEYLAPRVYLNNKNGQLVKKEDAFQNVLLTASCVVPCDFNKDGYDDLFIAARAVPWEYGKTPRSFLLQNDRTGKFIDVTVKYAIGLDYAGLIKQAVWADIDNDKDQDLILSLEWDGIVAFINDKGSFSKKYLTDKKGWWNFVLPVDIDKDGDLDFIAGNQGLNSRLKATEKEPVRMYLFDFDGNGRKEQVLTYYLNGREIPFANKAELEKQVPSLKRKFLYAKDFAKASLEELFTKEKLSTATVLIANYFSNVVLVNEGQNKFALQELPWQAQLTSYRDAVIYNANGDNLPDIFMGGNFFANNVQIGRSDADYGTILVNKGNRQFDYNGLNNSSIKGEVRHIRKINYTTGTELYLVIPNNDSLIALKPDF